MTVIATAKTVVSIGQYLNQKLIQYREDKNRDFFNELLRSYRDGACSPEEFEETIDAQISSMKSRDSFMRILSFSYKTLLDSVDDRVIPALARLTAEYMEKVSNHDDSHFKAPVDAFFRGSCRLLSDITGDEFIELQKLCGSFAELPQNASFFYLDFTPGPIKFYDPSGVPNAGLTLHWLETGFVAVKSHSIAHAGQFEHIERLTHLLATNGFQSEPPDPIGKVLYGKFLIWLNAETAKRLARITLNKS